MRHLIISRVTLVWLALVGATIVSWKLSNRPSWHQLSYANGLIFLIAFLKVHFVIFDFMELRHSPLLMRIAADTWAVTVCGILVFSVLPVST